MHQKQKNGKFFCIFFCIGLGIMFGLVGGIMIFISINELLPLARKKDKEDKYTSKLVLAGFVVMDLSLILFKI